MRFLVAWCLMLAAASGFADRILLVPLDSRPAAGQFAQMIGKMANVTVNMPPYELLGRFTSPGDPDQILQWLGDQDLSDVRAIICSTDMIAYGGLIASRTNETAEEDALIRLRKLLEIKRKSATTKLYLFSSTMRLAPTSTKQTEKFRMRLAMFEEAKDKANRNKDSALLDFTKRLYKTLPPGAVENYEDARRRDHNVQAALLRMTARPNDVEFLIIGQDDARRYGPHVPETRQLQRLSTQLHADRKVYFCEGVDQDANVLLSRALLAQTDWVPHVRVVYSDEAAKTKYAAYEASTIEHSLKEQLLASGAETAATDGEFDYTLYLNVPHPSPERFDEFLAKIKSDLDQGFPCAVADINLGKASADPQLVAGLLENGRGMRLLSFAGWNTAGNSIGTTIPAANVYLLARRLGNDPQKREVAQREFLLHRFINDFDYHRFVRPKAYALLKALNEGKEEVYGSAYEAANSLVDLDLRRYLDSTFRDQLLGHRFFAGTGQYVFTALKNVRIWLPWPRAYEVRIEFQIESRPADADTDSSPK